MSGNFDWHTEEDESLWEDIDRSQPTPPRPRRLWPYLIVAVLALSLVGFAVIRQVGRHVEETESRIKEDVLAANQLVQRAAAESDRELLVSMLSGRDARWTIAQGDLSDVSLLFGNAASPLGLRATDTTPISETVELSNDLKEAFVSAERLYAFDIGNGLTDTVTLEQTVVYRQGRRSWLLAPPQDEFWGGWAMTSGRLTSVAYPARDEPFAVRFAVDVEARLTDLCNLRECPDGLSISIRFDPDPEALLGLAAPEARLEPGIAINLPSPTLVGTPVDEDGYDALSRAYAALVVTSVLGDLLEWECCDKIAFYEAVVNQTLSELALIPYPLQPADYLDLANYPVTFATRPASVWEVRSLDGLDPVDRNYAHAVVAYLLAEGAELAEMQDRLIATGTRQGTGGLSQWMGRSSASSLDTESWESFVRDQAAGYQSSRQPPTPLPEQDLLISCVHETNGTAGLFRYNVRDETFNLEMPLPNGIFFAVALPDDSGYVMVTGVIDDSLTETFLVRPGEDPIQITWNVPEDLLVYFGAPDDPLGEYIVFWIIAGDDLGPTYGLLAPTACRDVSSCRPTELPGTPVWSPDGQRIIVAQNNGIMLLGDRELSEWTSLGPGFSPFWIDDDTYGFSRDGNSGLFTAQVDGGDPELLLTTGDLSAYLPQSGQRFRPTFQRVLTHPALPDTLLVVTTHGLSESALLFRVSLPPPGTQSSTGVQDASQEISLLVDGLSLNLPEPMQIVSPDGRWLAAVATPGGFLFYDLETDETIFKGGFGDSFSFGLHDWSANSSWMAFVGAKYVELMAAMPDGGLFRRVLFHEDYTCSSAIWLNKAP